MFLAHQVVELFEITTVGHDIDSIVAHDILEQRAQFLAEHDLPVQLTMNNADTGSKKSKLFFIVEIVFVCEGAPVLPS